jgi:hypothetical protein
MAICEKDSWTEEIAKTRLENEMLIVSMRLTWEKALKSHSENKPQKMFKRKCPKVPLGMAGITREFVALRGDVDVLRDAASVFEAEAVFSSHVHESLPRCTLNQT